MPLRLLSPAWIALAALCGACRTTRTLEVESDPPGALVRLDEEVIGRTPLVHSFVHGGQRRLSLYLPGFRTWSRRVDLEMPWYDRFPLDILTEVILPLGLHHRFPFQVHLTLDTREEESDLPAIDAYIARAAHLRATELARARREREGQ